MKKQLQASPRPGEGSQNLPGPRGIFRTFPGVRGRTSTAAGHGWPGRAGLLLIGLMTLAGCEKSGNAPAASTAPAGSASIATQPGDPLSISVGPELAGMIKVVALQQAEVNEQLRIAGRLELNGYKTSRIGAPVTGRITEVRALIGQEVRQGDTLAEINSQELTAAQLAFLKAHSAEQLAQRAVERADLLLASDVIGSAEVQRRQNELTVARAEKRASADQLRVLGISSRAVEQLETTGRLIAAAPITASQSGTIIERKIANGQVVQPSDALFVISDLRSVWATAEVPEQEALQVRRGQKVALEIPALGNARLTGNIVVVADVVNPETRTVRIGVDLDNPDKMLKPQMLITMLIDGRSSARTVVPAAAVIRDNDQDHLFVETAPSRYTLRRVRLGVEKDGVRPVLEALPAGTRIVSEGSFHLNNERQKRNIETGGKVPPADKASGAKGSS